MESTDSNARWQEIAAAARRARRSRRCVVPICVSRLDGRRHELSPKAPQLRRGALVLGVLDADLGRAQPAPGRLSAARQPARRPGADRVVVALGELGGAAGVDRDPVVGEQLALAGRGRAAARRRRAARCGSGRACTGPRRGRRPRRRRGRGPACSGRSGPCAPAATRARRSTRRRARPRPCRPLPPRDLVEAVAGPAPDLVGARRRRRVWSARQPSRSCSSNSRAAVAGSISRRTTRSSSSVQLGVARRRAPRARAAAARRRSRAPRRAGCAPGARPACPRSAMWSPCASIVSTSSAIPSPLVASVRTTGTFQSRSGPSASTALTSRIIVSASGCSALLTHDHVGDLHHARLQRLDRVARAGHQREHDRVGVVDDVDLALADADGLEQDVVLARGVHQQRRLQRRLGEPAERAAGGHRADEDARVEEVVGEPDPVAEHGALGERARGVDREHADLAVGLAQLGADRADQGALADPGRAGEADDPRLAGAREELGDQPVALGVAVLDQADRPRQRPLVAGDEALGERSRRGLLAGASAKAAAESRVRAARDPDPPLRSPPTGCSTCATRACCGAICGGAS